MKNSTAIEIVGNVISFKRKENSDKVLILRIKDANDKIWPIVTFDNVLKNIDWQKGDLVVVKCYVSTYSYEKGDRKVELLSLKFKAIYKVAAQFEKSGERDL